MIESDTTKQHQNRWKKLALFIVVFFILMVLLKLFAQYIEEKFHRPPARSTLSISTQDLLDRYNQAMMEIDRGLLLPPDNAMENGGGNGKFHSRRHAVRPNILVSTEVENTTSKPFSLGLYATPQGTSDGVSMVAVQAAIGVTFFGKGDNAGALVRACAATAKDDGKPVSMRVETFDVFCSIAGGIWIAGISVPEKM